MFWRVAAVLAVGALVELGLTGRVGEPQALVYAGISLLVSRLLLHEPKPRELGRMWGTLDQKLALEAAEQRRAMRRLRSGRPLTEPVPQLSFVVETLRKEFTSARRLWTAAIVAAGLCAGLFVVDVFVRPDPLRLISLAVLVPVLITAGRRGRSRATSRLALLERAHSPRDSGTRAAAGETGPRG